MATSLPQAGGHQEALDRLQRALAARGPEPTLHTELAAAYLALGRLLEAEAHCRQALRLNPNLPDAACILGVALRRRGRVAEALQAFREALRLRPDHPDALRQLRELTATPPLPPKLAEVFARLQERLRLEPDSAELRHDLGMALLAGGQPARPGRTSRKLSA